MNLLLKYNLLLLLFLIIYLPGGSIGGVNVKVIVFLVTIFLFFVYIIKKKKLCNHSIHIYIILILSLIFILFWILVTLVLDQEFYVTEARLFFTYFFTCSIFLISIVEGIISPLTFLKVVFYSVIIYALSKLLIIVLFFYGILDLNIIVNFMFENFGIEPMLLPLGEGITRFQLANDYIITFILFFMITIPKNFIFISKNLYIFSLVVLILATIISFSRYMFLVITLAFSLYILFTKTKYKIFYLSLAFYIFISLLIFYWDFIYYLIEIRFNSTHNASSDSIRDIQITCLVNSSFDETLFFGHGLGTFNSICPANEKAPFAYEVQYLGYLYKFGILGFIIFILFYLSFFIKFLPKKLSMNLIPIYVSIFLWLLVGFFNPYLISAYATIITLTILVNSILITNNIKDRIN